MPSGDSEALATAALLLNTEILSESPGSESANTPETLITVGADSSATVTSATGATTIGGSLTGVTVMLNVLPPSVVVPSLMLNPKLSLVVSLPLWT